MTVRDLIYSTMRLTGVLASGETPQASEAQEALTSLNSMLGLWSIDGLLIYAITTESFDLVPSQQSYTIGEDGNFDTSRPSKILNAGLVDNNFEYPMQILNNQEWAGISAKSTQSTVPTKLYLETSYPLSVINLWPIPSAVKQLKLYSLKPLTQFVNLSEEISFPPGYAELLKYNLAIRLAPEYGKSVDPNIERLAIESKIAVERQGSRELLANTGLTNLVPRNYNILTGSSN